MSDLITKLLQGKTVEWKTLGEVCEFKRGEAITAKTKTNGNIPVISGGQKIAYYNGRSNRKDETITIAGSGAYAGFVMYWNEPIFVNDAFSIKPNLLVLNTLYIYHFLLQNQYKIYSMKKGAGISHVYSKDLAKLQIPIPPLSVQAEIVRILDSFTALTAELTAELSMRKKQYNYYRDTLLTFKDGQAEWKTLGILCIIGDGLHGTPDYDIKGDYFFINGNNLSKNIVLNEKTNRVNYSMFQKHGVNFELKNTIFLSINGTIGNVAFYNNENIVLGKSVAYFKIISTSLNTKYLFYFLQTNFSKAYFEVQKTGSTIKNLGLKALRNFKIPIPPLAEQERIVAILDKFDTITNSITEGLPREIVLRQKQYEYYREQLLNFPK